jgi:Antibiotic biosynthesis monooxygenase
MSSLSSEPVPSAAQIRIAANLNMVTVIQRFEVLSTQHADFIRQASEQIAQNLKKQPKFFSAVLFRGRDSEQIAFYSQWAKTADSPKPATVPTEWSLASVLPRFTLLDSRTYTVEFTDAAGQPTLISLTQTPLAHFGIFTMSRDNQDRLLDLARDNAPRAVKTTSGLISVNFHRSIDGLQAINVGAWNTFDSLKQLEQQPGFTSSSPYWSGVADFQAQFFDLVLLKTAS